MSICVYYNIYQGLNMYSSMIQNIKSTGQHTRHHYGLSTPFDMVKMCDLHIAVTHQHAQEQVYIFYNDHLASQLALFTHSIVYPCLILVKCNRKLPVEFANIVLGNLLGSTDSWTAFVVLGDQC